MENKMIIDEYETCDVSDCAMAARDPHTSAAYLVSLEATGLTKHVFQLEDDTKIGRSKTASLQIRRRDCSRQHARVWLKDGHWFIEDLGSSNGTRVNRKRITETQLGSRDDIDIATAPFRFFYGSDPELDFHKAVEVNASLDALTGLFNREVVKARTLEALSGPNDPAFLIIDIDRFKQINDQIGHLAGDEVLIEVARRIKAECGHMSTVSRISGDEFAILVSDSSKIDAQSVGNRVCSAVSRQPILFGECPLPVTVSVGLATPSAGSARTVSAIMMAADKALYEAKVGGRNQACVNRL